MWQTCWGVKPAHLIWICTQSFLKVTLGAIHRKMIIPVSHEPPKYITAGLEIPENTYRLVPQVKWKAGSRLKQRSHLKHRLEGQAYVSQDSPRTGDSRERHVISTNIVSTWYCSKFIQDTLFLKFCDSTYQYLSMSFKILDKSINMCGVISMLPLTQSISVLWTVMWKHYLIIQ